MSFDKELFYGLCEKYGVELSDKYTQSMIEDNGVVRPLCDEDIRNIVPRQVKNDCLSTFRFYNEQANS